MKWTRGYRSDDVEVRPGEGPRAGGLGGNLIGMLISLVISRFGLLGGLVVVAGYLLLSQVVGGGSTGSNTAPDRSDPRVEFASAVLDDVQQTWTRKLAEQNVDYRKAKLVI